MVLIVGASGFIGNKFYHYFKDNKINVRGTYFSNIGELNKEDRIYLDLENGNIDEIKRLKDLSRVIFCHGISEVEKCKNNQDLTNLVNVKNTFKLLEYCKDANIKPVYLSTNMVFDGMSKFPSETCVPNPISEYGRQKLAVENFIIKNFKQYLILRLTKVFGVERGDGSLFTSWLDKLLINESIKAANNIFISPIYVMDVIKITDSLLENQVSGVFNLGGLEIERPSDFAKKMAVFFRLDLNLVKEVSIESFAFTEKRPHFSSLDSKNVRQCLAINLTTIDDCLAKISTNYNLNRH